VSLSDLGKIPLIIGSTTANVKSFIKAFTAADIKNAIINPSTSLFSNIHLMKSIFFFAILLLLYIRIKI
tara:strand:+ start:1997 stop:2203 length:207 start_codon:yes stop_codon:yes gene_type:complete